MRASLISEAFSKRVLQVVLPKPVYLTGKRLYISHQAQKLVAECGRQKELGGVVDIVLQSRFFRPEQKRTEILGLLRLLDARRPKLLCEVGGLSGGSLALFAHIARADARLLSIDINYAPGQIEALAALARGRQRIACISGDSHAAATVDRLRQWLNGELLDFLFIDGDHALAGVSQDFDLLSRFVRDDGIIAFHDIIPDSLIRTGTPTDAWVGDVPRLWQQIRASGCPIEEFVDDRNQDGFGIGVLYWTAQARTAFADTTRASVDAI